MNGTPHLKPGEINRRWYLLNADGIVLGRLASLVSQLLRGKGKATYSRHMDQGDGVVVINAQKIRLTGRKLDQKLDFRHSGHTGGARFTPYSRIMRDKPERALELAVSGMLPKNRLRKRFMKRLKVFRADEGQKKYGGAVAINLDARRMSQGGPFVPLLSEQTPAPMVTTQVDRL